MFIMKREAVAPTLVQSYYRFKFNHPTISLLLFSIPPYRLTVCPIYLLKAEQILLETELTAGTIINTPGPNNIYVWFEDRP
jgi:hypothetical protein